MMDIEIIKDIFFFIGSFLGIVAFISISLDPLLKNNQEKWKNILKYFNDDFFLNLEGLHETRDVTREELRTIWHFLNEIREDKDFLRLKFPSKRNFSKHLSNFEELAKEFDKQITPPVWDNEFPPSNDGNRYTLNKQYFREHFDHLEVETAEYLKHLNKATDLVIQMRIEFRAMQTIANLNFIELFFKKLLIRQSTKQLKKANLNLNDSIC